MKKTDLVKKWLRALRSGKYKQGRDQLYNGRRYCCLGVYCDLMAKETGRGAWASDEYFERMFVFNGKTFETTLPEGFRRELGLTPKRLGHLIDMNDGYGGMKRQTFEQIADQIEEWCK